jgi:bacterioferritin (cytochrome b1)
MIEEMLASKEEHQRCLESKLELIQQFGEANCPARQIRQADSHK